MFLETGLKLVRVSWGREEAVLASQGNNTGERTPQTRMLGNGCLKEYS